MESVLCLSWRGGPNPTYQGVTKHYAHTAPFCANLLDMSAKKTLLRFLAIYFIAFVLVYLIPQHIHRRAFDKAFVTFLRDPTPQNEEAFRVEQRKNEIIMLAVSAVIALVPVAMGAGIYLGIRFAQSKSARIPPVR
jgi:ABC-type phosphate transport system permease subunit